MARLFWNQEGQNRYEFGVDRGVFYDGARLGHVWNGLRSVDEDSDGGELLSYHFDGIKYLDMNSPRNYKAVLSAFAAPSQFAASIGYRSVVPGFVLTRQARYRFGLSYRTRIEGPTGYQIHVVYNVMASPASRSRSTIAEEAEPEARSWQIEAVPLPSETYRPAAHFIFDSLTLNPDILSVIESILYGSDDAPAYLPDIDRFLDMVTVWAPLFINHQSLSGLSELISGMGDLYRTSIDGLNRVLPQTRLLKTPIAGLYRLE